MVVPQAILTDFRVILFNQNFISIAGFIFLSLWVSMAYFQSQARQLKDITTVGSSLPLLSHIHAVKFFISAGRMVNDGIMKGSGRLFKVPDFLQWIVVAGDRQSLEDIRKAPEHVLSATQAMSELIQTEYTFGSQIVHDPYHVPIIRTAIPRALPRLMIDVHDEIVHACNDHLPSTTAWTPLTISSTVMDVVARATNRVFVGKQLCRNPVYLNTNVRFATDVVSIAFILKFVPKPLRSTVNRLLSNVPRLRQKNLEYLDPIINERRRQRQNPIDGAENPADILDMLMDGAKGEENTNSRLSDRLMMINFAAIHTTSMSFAQALLCLAEYPQCAKLLRSEAEDVVSRHGWTKVAIDEMPYIDAFLKETQRLHPLETISMLRVAMEDYTFSNGTTVPKGTTVAIPVMPSHLNNAVYKDAHIFDPLRFIKLKAEEDDPHKAKKYDMITTSTDFLTFGHGRHACPGRFFAAAELKLMLAYFVLHYDIKLEKEGVRPKDFCIYTARMVRPTAKALFRKREAKSAS
ncbi:cytochrome P450 [Panaeolus papilionaceus]|nr:cytochrome P450 [Panaeolus papilionaceus]